MITPISRAQIVATLGPATNDKEIMRKLIERQMDAVRLNFSWGTHEEHAHYIAAIREVAKELNKRIPIIQDLSGPRVQTKEGHGFMPSAKEVITEKDLRDLDFGIAQRLEYVALSYVGGAQDVRRLAEEIAKRGGAAKIIGKIERKQALERIDEIIKASDAIMIARGDLAESIPLEQVPFAQHLIIKKCKAAKKPVIVATQMLLSMVEHSTPTRAEVHDVAHAILEGADAVMLSEESARGKYPIEAVAIMERIVLEAEKHEKKIEINPL